MSEPRVLRLGTRGSALALRQTEAVAEAIRRRHPEVEIEIRKIRTTADRTSAPLRAIGGKGLFIKEIEDALCAGDVDAGIHSLKDMTATLPGGLAIAAVPEREDPRDALVSARPGGLVGLERRARVGTGSLRRQALLRHLRPDLEVVDIRGNVDTRIRRWKSGELDALVLAVAGIRRLGLEVPEAQPLSAEQFLPAIGQGAIAIEASPDGEWWSVLVSLDDPPTALATTAERAFLQTVGGDCKTPIAAHATVSAERLRMRAMIADPSGERIVQGERSGLAGDGREIGRDLGEELLERGGRRILEDCLR